MTGRPVAPRLAAKVELNESTGCLLWTGSIDDKGYARLWVGGASGRCARAHRLAYELAKGPIPAGLDLDHLCPEGAPTRRPGAVSATGRPVVGRSAGDRVTGQNRREAGKSSKGAGKSPDDDRQGAASRTPAAGNRQGGAHGTPLLPDLTSGQVCAITGITYRTLDYWVRTRGIGSAPRGSGRPRRFTRIDAARVAVMARWLRTGGDLAGADAIAGVVADAVAEGDTSGWVVVPAGRRALLVREAADVVDLLARADAPLITTLRLEALVAPLFVPVAS